MKNVKVKTKVVPLYNGRYSVYIESKIVGGEIMGEKFGDSITSKPFKDFKSEKRATLCKRKLDRYSDDKLFAWNTLSEKPKLKC